MIDTLVRASLDGAVMVCGIWLLSRAVPRLPAGVKATLWWCAAAKFVVTMAWGAPLVLPVLPAAERTASVTVGRSSGEAVETVAAQQGIASPVPVEATGPAPFDWTTMLGVLWMAGVAITVALGCRRWSHMRRVIARSQPADDFTAALADEVGDGLALVS